MDLTIPPAEASDCRAVGEILGRIGDRWTVLVVVALRDRPRRFNDLKRAVGGISQQTLTFTLKILERDGTIGRTVRPTTRPQVSYELTNLGRSLSDIVRQLAEWSIENLVSIQGSREQYDRRDPRI